MVKKKILLKNHHRTNNKKKKKQTRAETARAVTTFATSLKTFVDDLCAESGTNDSEEESALKTSASKFVDIINNNNNNTRNPTERKASTGNDTAKSQANVQIGKAQQKHVEEATSILNSAADKKNEPNDDHPKKKPGKHAARNKKKKMKKKNQGKTKQTSLLKKANQQNPLREDDDVRNSSIDDDGDDDANGTVVTAVSNSVAAKSYVNTSIDDDDHYFKPKDTQQDDGKLHRASATAMVERRIVRAQKPKPAPRDPSSRQQQQQLQQQRELQQQQHDVSHQIQQQNQAQYNPNQQQHQQLHQSTDRNQDGKPRRPKIVLSKEARQALAKAIWSAIRSPTGEIDPDLMLVALNLGLPKHAILNAARVAREREAAKRKAAQYKQQQQLQQQQQPQQHYSQQQPNYSQQHCAAENTEENELDKIFSFHGFDFGGTLVDDCISNESLRELIAKEKDGSCLHSNTSGRYHLSRALEVLLIIDSSDRNHGCYNVPPSLKIAVERLALGGITLEEANLDPKFSHFLVSTVTNLILLLAASTSQSMSGRRQNEELFIGDFLTQAVENKHRYMLDRAFFHTDEKLHVAIRHAYNHSLLQYTREMESKRGCINICYRETQEFCPCMQPLQLEAKKWKKFGICYGCSNMFPEKELQYCSGCLEHVYCSYECSRNDWVNCEHKKVCAKRHYIRCSTCRVIFPSNELSNHECMIQRGDMMW